MGDASLSLNLLLAKDMQQAFKAAGELDSANQQRQQLEMRTAECAEVQLRQRKFSTDWASITVHGEDWHPGVLGIVAARLSRTHHRPSVVLSLEANGLYSGSVRSIAGINIVEVLDSVSHLLERHGGHAMAAGLSLQPQNIHAFIDEFETAVATKLTEDLLMPKLETCGVIRLSELNDEFFEQRDMLEPFGHSNPEPLYICRDVYPDKIMKAGADHTRGVLCESAYGSTRINFIAFRRVPESLPPPPWDVVVKPQINNYMGRSTPQVEIVDIRSAGIL